jgi:flagellar protein FlbD
VIALTRLNGRYLAVNPDLIQFLEQTPDTVITLTSGEKLMVLESPEEVTTRIVQYRHRILRGDVTGACPVSVNCNSPIAMAEHLNDEMG